jgi:hypothetical protein
MYVPNGLSRDVQKSEAKSREFNIAGPFLRPLVKAPFGQGNIARSHLLLSRKEIRDHAASFAC